MRKFLWLLLTVAQLAHAQSLAPTTSSDCAPLTATYSAMFGAQQLNSISIVGSVSRSGQIDSFAFYAVGGDRSRLEIGGSRLIEARNTSGSEPFGQWQIDGGDIHQMATQNLWIPAGWMIPQSIVLAGLSQGSVCVLMPQERKGDQLLDHIRFYRVLPVKTSAYQTAVSKLSTVDLFLDPTTHLPRVFSAFQHADLDASANIPVEVWFSDYKLVSGVLSPFEIQAYLNGDIQYDVTVSNVTINSELNTNNFELQN